MIVFEGNQIKKSYKHGKKNILKGIDLKGQSGQCIGILGANGCGKSTLLSILAGLEPMDEGTLNIEGTVGYVPQQNPLMDELTAKDHLKLWYAGKESALEQSLNEGVLQMLGVSEFLDVYVKQMSGGMKKRLSIGCAVANEPNILLLDEPGAALDLICKERIYVYLSQFKKQGGLVLIATHEEREIDMCDQLYILKEGTLHPYQYDGNVHHIVKDLR